MKRINLSNGNWLRLFALVLAILLYWSISRQLNEERPVSNVPVELKLDDNLIATREYRFDADIVVRAPKSELGRVEPRSFYAIVSVGAANRQSDGSYFVKLQPEDFRGPQGMKVVSVDSRDAGIRLRLQRRIQRELPVSPRFSGQLSPEYRRAEVRTVPATVMVSGPENMIRNLKEVRTQPIPLSEQVVDSFEYESELGELPELLEVSPGTVRVQVDIERALDSRTFRGLPVQLMQSASPLRLEATAADEELRCDVTVSGVAPAVAVLRPEDLRVFVDASGCTTPGSYTLPLECLIREPGIDVRVIRPAELTVKVQKR